MYGSWIYNYLCNQCLSPLMLWVRIPLRWGVLNTALCGKICQWLGGFLWISSTNKTDCHDIAVKLLKVVVNTITLPTPIVIKSKKMLTNFNGWKFNIWVTQFQGCRVRDHIVTVSDLPTEGDKPPQNRVYEDLLSHRDVICVPYQRLSDARYTLGVCWTV